MIVEVPSFYEPRPTYHHYYVLRGRTPEPVRFELWCLLHGLNNKVVKQDNITGAFVSTVFLGINHAHDEGPPLLFETMIFWNDERDNNYQTRCSTWKQAEVHHRIAIAMVLVENTVWRQLKSQMYRAWKFVKRLF